MEQRPGHHRRALAALIVFVLLVGLPPSLGSARSVQTPPPTPVPVPGGGTSPSPFPSVLVTPDPTVQAPEIGAAAAVLADLDSGQVLYGKEQNERLPIASLTKIMTALLTLERATLTDVVTVSEDAADPGPVVGISQLGLVPGERITVEQLLYALMLQSANDAALALAEHVSGSVEAFVRAMNRRGERLGLADTRFASPNGLDDAGYSSAADLMTLTRAAFAQPLFAQIVGTEFHQEPPPQPGGIPRTVQNRNVLLWLYPGATGVKTGFTSAAGFCVVGTAERNGVRLVSVVLGDAREPFSDAAALLNYGFTAFEHRRIVTEGEIVGSVEIGGRDVPVAAGSAVSGLVPVDVEIRRVISMDPDVTFPPGIGEAVGALTISVPGVRIGRVPLVVVSVPPPPSSPEPGPWWRRAVSSVVQAVDGLLRALFR